MSLPTYAVFARIVLIHCVFKFSSHAYPQTLVPTIEAKSTKSVLEKVLKLVGFSPLKSDVSIQSHLPKEFLVPFYTGIPEHFSASVLSSKFNLNFTRRHSGELPLIKVIQPSNVNETDPILRDISAFYESNPDQVSMIYFFILWPETKEDWEGITHYRLRTAVFNAPLDSHLYLVQLESGTVSVWEYYTVKHVSVFERINLQMESDLIRRVIRRGNFRGVTFNGVIHVEGFIPVPIQFKIVNGTEIMDGGNGLVLNSFHVLASSLNFSIKYVLGSGFMTLGTDVGLTGTGQQLLTGEGDMLLSFTTELAPYRLEKLSCSQAVISHRVQAYYKKSDPSLYRNVLAQAFTPSLWATAGASAVIIYFSFGFFSYIQRKYDDSSLQQHDVSVGVTKHAFLWTVASICQQGWHCSPTSTSLRIVAFTAMLSSLLYYTAYAASIVSILWLDYNPLKTTDDLLKYGYTLYGNKFSITGLQYVFDLARKEGVPHQTRDITIKEALDKLQTSRSALLFVRYAFFPLCLKQNETLERLCTWVEETTLPRDSMRQLGVVYFRKFDPLRKFVDYQLSRWKDSGLLFHYREEFDQTPSYRCDPPRKQARKLSVQDVTGAYFILFGGYAISLIILVIEVMVYSANKGSQSQHTAIGGGPFQNVEDTDVNAQSEDKIDMKRRGCRTTPFRSHGKMKRLAFSRCRFCGRHKHWRKWKQA